ncbi:MAG: ArsR family transcriptional regulator [Candidatus Neomarinimicrobiota bacterium]|nr:MAG: ArsR family transcriptional regulator [Candidatus Neomarinimicrobiota bacterium]
MQHLIRTFKGLSDPNRIRILKLLEIRPLCVCELTAILELAPSTVSKHLSLLAQAGLVTSDKSGKWVTYSLNFSQDEPYARHLLPLLRSWLQDDSTLARDRDKLRTIKLQNKQAG